jgi:hypothetical protein
MDSKTQHLTVITIPTTFGGKLHLLMETSSTGLTAFAIVVVIILAVCHGILSVTSRSLTCHAGAAFRIFAEEIRHVLSGSVWW